MDLGVVRQRSKSASAAVSAHSLPCAERRSEPLTGGDGPELRRRDGRSPNPRLLDDVLG
jgi:hypothetical protein